MKILETILNKLSSKPEIAGLGLSDSAIQYVFLGKDVPRYFSLRLPPGIIREGKLEKPDELLLYLRDLQLKVSEGNPKRRHRLIVALPPEIIYTQSFNVPKIDREKLKEAAQLNLQIISPIEAGGAYMSYQVIGETEDRYDLLGAFVAKEVVDRLTGLLGAAGFDVLIFEFPALALSRIVAQTLSLPPEPFILLQVSSEGLDLSILRNKSLYFEYFRSWRSIQGEAREITRTAFEEAVTHEVKKVLDFSMSRFRETIKNVLVLAPGFEKEIGSLIGSYFSLTAVPLVLKNYPLGAAWYPVLGSALRGEHFRGRDPEINLSSRSLTETFYQERVLGFLRLWRNIAVGTVSIFLVVFGIAAALLVNQSKSLTGRLNAFRADVSQQEFTALRAGVREFNYLVQGVKGAKSESRPWYEIMARLKQLADGGNITITGLSIGSGAPVSLTGRGLSTTQVIRFKNVLVEEPGFSEVDLPLSAITTLEDNSVSFSVNFKIRDQGGVSE